MENKNNGRKHQHHKNGSVRLLEKRRLGTCAFADRVAQLSVETFIDKIPKEWRDNHPQACISTIVAHFPSLSGELGHLQVMALGVGTKFLSESVLKEDENSSSYGTKVRDCHAEVLARRAFRLQISREMLSRIRPEESLQHHRPILQLCSDSNTFELVHGITLHMYTSSAPCGNASFKKFAKVTRETFMEHLGPDEWPEKPHDKIVGHALTQGQFALLVKKDVTIINNTNQAHRTSSSPHLNKKCTSYIEIDDDSFPPGTSMNQGSIHTCSDKICRWNFLGFQGSLLSSLMKHPVSFQSFIVGRKFARSICQRAICCRAEDGACPSERRRSIQQSSKNKICECPSKAFTLNHPSIMCTSVYLNDDKVISMSGSHIEGGDVRFSSRLCWAWWPSRDNQDSKSGGFLLAAPIAECIDGLTGMALNRWDEDKGGHCESKICTAQLTSLFLQIVSKEEDVYTNSRWTLRDIRLLKRSVSRDYEDAKDWLLVTHRIFRRWKRRYPFDETSI